MAGLRSVTANMTMADSISMRTNGSCSSPETQIGLLSRAAGVRSNERSFKKGERIYARDEPSRYVYAVIKGAVRASHYLSDGRRHLGAFHLPGDIFGLDSNLTRSLETEAVVKTTMLAVRRDDLDRESSIDPKLAWGLCNIVSDDLRSAQDHLLLLGRKLALERVAAFLLEMDRRLSTDGIMSLPMCGLDIADYLGLSNETVSRCLTKLQTLRIISLSEHRTVTFLDRDGLHEIDAC